MKFEETKHISNSTTDSLNKQERQPPRRGRTTHSHNSLASPPHAGHQPGHTLAVGRNPIPQPGSVPSQPTWLRRSRWHEQHTQADPTTVGRELSAISPMADCKSGAGSLRYLSVDRVRKWSSWGAVWGRPLRGFSLPSSVKWNSAFSLEMLLGLAPKIAAAWFCGTPA